MLYGVVALFSTREPRSPLAEKKRLQVPFPGGASTPAKNIRHSLGSGKGFEREPLSRLFPRAVISSSSPSRSPQRARKKVLSHVLPSVCSFQVLPVVLLVDVTYWWPSGFPVCLVYACLLRAVALFRGRRIEKPACTFLSSPARLSEAPLVWFFPRISPVYSR